MQNLCDVRIDSCALTNSVIKKLDQSIKYCESNNKAIESFEGPLALQIHVGRPICACDTG
jgi:hypothetical protein